jgi:hypothetical protein
MDDEDMQAVAEVHDDPEEAEAHEETEESHRLKLIQEARETVLVKKKSWDVAKDAASVAKKAYERAVEDLMDASSPLAPLPLFDNPPAEEEEPEAWRGVRLADIGVCGNLLEILTQNHRCCGRLHRLRL